VGAAGWCIRAPSATKPGQMAAKTRTKSGSRPIFFVVFLKSPHRETPKNVIKKNREKVGFGFLVEFFEKLFDTIFFAKRFCSVFELPSPKNTRKPDKTKKVEEKLTSKMLKKFSTWSFCNLFWGCF
jgi:hypothetical protein